MTEQWRPVLGYEGRYEVSDRGGIWSVKKGRPMTPYRHAVGYLAVGLWDDQGRRTTTYLHRIVATAFVARRDDDNNEVCHRDGDPLNNAADNLYWGTRADNMRDAVAHGTHHQSRKTHCKHGHEFTPENTLTNSKGNRECLACRPAIRARYEAKRKASR